MVVGYGATPCFCGQGGGAVPPPWFRLRVFGGGGSVIGSSWHSVWLEEVLLPMRRNYIWRAFIALPEDSSLNRLDLSTQKNCLDKYL